MCLEPPSFRFRSVLGRRAVPAARAAAAGAVLLLTACAPREPLPPRTALDDYVNAADPAYDWEILHNHDAPAHDELVVELVSQSWRSPDEVDRTTWKHWLVVVRPEEIRTDTALLFIGGGRNGGQPPGGADRRLREIALANGTVVAELGMVPNQPLTFADGRPRVEDDLIAWTWNRFLDTGDANWPARNPMVKSAVRAMDAIQDIQSGTDGGEIEGFVVAGASKRGWTTWLTGAVDERVRAIVPIVIDVLNIVPSMDHHHAAYGFWAPAIGDYERNGIMDRRHEPRYRELMRLVDPWYYRHRLEMPKLLIHATGDQFFLPDSSRFYFDGLRGEKHLRYVPNADHSLDGTDAGATLEAFFRTVAHGLERPRYSWSFPDERTIVVTSATKPAEVTLWSATNPEARDFRLQTIGEAWTSRTLEWQPAGETPGSGSGWVARVEEPERGWTAFFVELTWPVEGPNPLKVTTPVRVVPDTLPHAGEIEPTPRP